MEIVNETGLYMTNKSDTECAYYPASNKLVVINNSDQPQQTKVLTEQGEKEFFLQPYETVFASLSE